MRKTKHMVWKISENAVHSGYKFDIIFSSISYVSFKSCNVQHLSANNFNKNQFWENWNGNFVQLNLMTIFTTIYEILVITGGEIDLRFKDGATVYCIFKQMKTTDWSTTLLLYFIFNASNNKNNNTRILELIIYLVTY